MASESYPSRLADQFQLRFAEGLHERIKVAAAENGRSMNAELNHRLQASFGTAATLHPDIAALLTRYIESEVSARLQKIASAIGERSDA